MRVHRSREHNVRSFNVKEFQIAFRVKRKIWKRTNDIGTLDVSLLADMIIFELDFR